METVSVLWNKEEDILTHKSCYPPCRYMNDVDMETLLKWLK